MTPTPAIDAHHHLWDAVTNRYPYLTDGSRDRMHGKPLPRRYLIEDYLRDIAGLGVTKSVHIQCGWDPTDPVGETRWLEGIARAHGYPQAIVAHADLADPRVEAVLEAHCAASPRLRGIRQHIGWHGNPRYRLGPRPAMLEEPAWRRGYALLARFGLSFDLQAFYPQFAAAARLAADFPDVPVLLGNAGMPVDRDPEALAAWRAALKPLAAQPNMWAKLGGFGMVEHEWTAATIRPFVRDLVEAFGPSRCLFGSNFPVDGLFRDFAGAWGAFGEATADLSDTDRRALFHDSAAQVYRLQE